MIGINITESYKEAFGKIGSYQIDDTPLNLSLIISAKIYKESDLNNAILYGLITEANKQAYIDISNKYIEGEIELEKIVKIPLTEIPPAIGLYYEQSINFLIRLLLGYKTEGDLDMITIKEWLGGIPYNGEPESINEIIKLYTDNNKIILVTY